MCRLFICSIRFFCVCACACVSVPFCQRYVFSVSLYVDKMICTIAYFAFIFAWIVTAIDGWATTVPVPVLCIWPIAFLALYHFLRSFRFCFASLDWCFRVKCFSSFQACTHKFTDRCPLHSFTSSCCIAPCLNHCVFVVGFSLIWFWFDSVIWCFCLKLNWRFLMILWDGGHSSGEQNELNRNYMEDRTCWRIFNDGLFICAQSHIQALNSKYREAKHTKTKTRVHTQKMVLNRKLSERMAVSEKKRIGNSVTTATQTS